MNRFQMPLFLLTERLIIPDTLFPHRNTDMPYGWIHRVDNAPVSSPSDNPFSVALANRVASISEHTSLYLPVVRHAPKPMQAFRPNTLATADATAITTLMIILQVELDFFSITLFN